MHHVCDTVRETRDWCSQSRVCWQYGAHLPTNNKVWRWAECHKVAMPRRRNREEITAAYKDSEAVLRFARPRIKTGVVSMRTWNRYTAPQIHNRMQQIHNRACFCSQIDNTPLVFGHRNGSDSSDRSSTICDERLYRCIAVIVLPPDGTVSQTTLAIM